MNTLLSEWRKLCGNNCPVCGGATDDAKVVFQYGDDDDFIVAVIHDPGRKRYITGGRPNRFEIALAIAEDRACITPRSKRAYGVRGMLAKMLMLEARD